MLAKLKKWWWLEEQGQQLPMITWIDAQRLVHPVLALIKGGA